MGRRGTTPRVIFDQAQSVVDLAVVTRGRGTYSHVLGHIVTGNRRRWSRLGQPNRTSHARRGTVP